MTSVPSSLSGSDEMDKVPKQDMRVSPPSSSPVAADLLTPLTLSTWLASVFCGGRGGTLKSGGRPQGGWRE